MTVLGRPASRSPARARASKQHTSDVATQAVYAGVPVGTQKKHMGSRSLHAVIPAIQWTAGCSLLDVHQKSSDICQATACPSTDVALSSPPTLNPSRHSLKDAADGEGRWWGQKQAARSVASLKSITSRNWNEHVLEVDAWTCGMSMLPN